MMSQILSQLWCPTCRAGGLRVEPQGEPDASGASTLRCEACARTYSVQDGYPVLVPEEAWTAPEWKLWRARLAKFQARRDARIAHPERPVTRLAGKSNPQPRFAAFTGITRGAVLDIGCGPGKFRFNFDLRRVRYVGLDPIPLPEASTFPFVQGLAEHLPFRDGTFTDIVVLAALDHFRYLDRFLREARRVLRPDGRMHVLQSVHRARGPISAVKMLTHKVKDALEERMVGGHSRDVPKHMIEFTERSLVGRMSDGFRVAAMERYSATWYSPDKLFLTFVRRTLEDQELHDQEGDGGHAAADEHRRVAREPASTR